MENEISHTKVIITILFFIYCFYMNLYLEEQFYEYIQHRFRSKFAERAERLTGRIQWMTCLISFKMIGMKGKLALCLRTCIISYISVSFFIFVAFLFVTFECFLSESCSLQGKIIGVVFTSASLVHFFWTIFYSSKVVAACTASTAKRRIWMTFESI